MDRSLRGGTASVTGLEHTIRKSGEPSLKSRINVSFFCPLTRVSRFFVFSPLLGTPNRKKPTQDLRMTRSFPDVPSAAIVNA